MAKRMLIDANHQDETRVVVFNDNRLEEYDYESASRKQLKGNIYLAKVTRVEPSLQAAFVEYGGNRQGFLSFSEIHPDYYRIPIADRQALIEQETSFEDDADNGNGNGESAEVKANGAQPAEQEPDEGEPEQAPAGKVEEIAVETNVDTVGGDEVEDASRRRASRLRRYKIQEVIKRRQVMLVQVSKEERGTKGAALTTYLSLAGRYCVLMPNTGKGGGISRKIANLSDRRRLKKVVSELEIPDGMAVIVRTAGSERSKVEIKRDYEYLVRLWNEIRDTTLASTAPNLIYEEANLIKRALRDLYTRDMDEILVEGEAGYKAAKAFVKNMIPSHARKVKLYKDEVAPLFHKNHVESQLDAMHSTTVQLKSGGYIVINPTEALVAIDVNSGKATRERHIEETARNTNLEAAEEVARQLRLRDLAGLIVIDFIDMEEGRHNRDVERRLKDAMRQDRARIQLGRISPFGLLELSRQRLRPSLFESSTVACERCGGVGHIRSSDSTAHHVVRTLEEEGMRGDGEIVVALPTEVAFYLMNHMRARLTEIEQRFGLTIEIQRDDSLVPPEIRLTRGGEVRKPQPTPDRERGRGRARAEDDEQKRGRGRRRRRSRDEEPASENLEQAAAGDGDAEPATEAVGEAETAGTAASPQDERGSKRRRGRRGGRRRTRRRRETGSEDELQASPESARPLDGEAPEPTADQPAPDVTDTDQAIEVSPSTPVADEVPTAPTEGEVQTTAPTGDEPQTVPSEDESQDVKPKPAGTRRRQARRRSTKRDNDAPAASVVPGEGEQPDIAAEEKPPVKKRPRRRRTPKTEAPAVAAETEAANGPQDAPPSNELPPLFPLHDEAPSAEPAAEPPVAESPAAQPNQVPEPEASPVAQPDRASEPEVSPDLPDEAVADPNRPKRKGWWQRWV